MEKKKNENLISIEEIIERAKKLGVDFGKGDPKNRLRYYTKIGLIPHAQRASFNGSPPVGAYHQEVIPILVSIDKKLKEGKSILQIKRELETEKEREIESAKVREEALPFRFETEKLSEILPFETEKKEFRVSKKRKIDFPKIFKKSILWILFSISLITFSFIISTKDGKNFLSSILATLITQGGLAQIAPTEMEKESLVFPFLEPYLTINADTQLNGNLTIRDNLIFKREIYQALFDFEKLTADRTYTFPDASGIVCLTSGNCSGLFGEVRSVAGTPNRLSKFISEREISNSSISDFYTAGISITISENGNVGIGTQTPEYKLHVVGRIQATDDICTDLGGGKCLSQLIRFFGGGGGGITGTGAAGTLALWNSASTLGSSLIYQSGGNIGIDISSPTQKLDVAGIIKVLGFQMPTNATSGYVLMSDASGFGTWQPVTGALPSGQIGQTLRHDRTDWVANYFLYNTGSAIGIGTTSTDLAILTVSGNGLLLGELTITTTTLPQLILKYDDGNFLQFLISSTSTTILASKDLYINSLTGEIIASDATVTAHTFRADDATVRAPQEYVFRQSIPIFKFPTPAQTASTSFIQVSRYFAQTETLDTLPPTLPNTTRKYGFLINEADDIPTSASSTWRIFRPAISAASSTFELSGQNQTSFDVGKPRLIGFTDLPNDDWQLEVQVPSGNTIRIFNIFLLVYDQLP